jgi:serine/threonine-protein kinase HipA
MTKEEYKIKVEIRNSIKESIPLGVLTLIDGKIYFKYNLEFLEIGINPSPFRIKFDDSIQACPQTPFDGLFGLFADSLPDGWGKLIVDRFLISKGKQPDKFNPLHRLSMIGENGIGALTFKPELPMFFESNFTLDLSDYAKKSLQILSNADELITDDFYQLTGTSGGARPKIQVAYNPKTNLLKESSSEIGQDEEYWIIKFPSITDLPDIANIEYAYYLMAIDAGIEISTSKLFSGKDNKQFFGTKRFDRNNGMFYHLHSAAGLLHDDFRKSTLDYGHLMDATVNLEKNKMSAEKVLRLAIFNVLTVNQDDHSKNFSFLMDKNGKWKFSPAYDLTFSPNMYGFQTTSVAGKNKLITKESFLELARHFDVSVFSNIWNNVHQVVSEWNIYAERANVNQLSKKRIWDLIKENLK